MLTVDAKNVLPNFLLDEIAKVSISTRKRKLITDERDKIARNFSVATHRETRDAKLKTLNPTFVAAKWVCVWSIWARSDEEQLISTSNCCRLHFSSSATKLFNPDFGFNETRWPSAHRPVAFSKSLIGYGHRQVEWMGSDYIWRSSNAPSEFDWSERVKVSDNEQRTSCAKFFLRLDFAWVSMIHMLSMPLEDSYSSAFIYFRIFSSRFEQ